MARSVRESYDEGQAAGRLRVPLAAWRWAVGSGLVPPADAGPGQWSRAVLDAVDPEQVRAALRGPIGAGVAADRLTDALGAPLRCRPRVTAAAVGHLAAPVSWSASAGTASFPTFTRTRWLPSRAAGTCRPCSTGTSPSARTRPLGAWASEGSTSTRWSGWVGSPRVGSVEIDYKRQGGVTTVPLYSAEDVALLPVVRPTVDWRAVYAVPAGRRSPLAALEPAPVLERVLLAEVARMARVGRAAVVNWRRRHPDFPAPVAGTDVHPQFDRAAVVAWLLAHDKIEVPVAMPSASLVVVGAGGRTFRSSLMARGWTWPTMPKERTRCPAGLPMRTPTSWPP